MANVGVSKPYYAVYDNSGATPTYKEGGVMGKATTVSVEASNDDPVVLYGDNGPAETDTTFGGGTLKLGLTELGIPIAAAVLGLTPGTSDTPSGTTLDFKASAAAPYVGIGCVVKKRVSGAAKWMGIILTKVQFKMPAVSLETQGKTISFQTPAIEAEILRDDSENEIWEKWGLFDTEANAESWIKAFLQIT